MLPLLPKPKALLAGCELPNAGAEVPPKRLGVLPSRQAAVSYLGTPLSNVVQYSTVCYSQMPLYCWILKPHKGHGVCEHAFSLQMLQDALTEDISCSDLNHK